MEVCYWAPASQTLWNIIFSHVLPHYFISLHHLVTTLSNIILPHGGLLLSTCITNIFRHYLYKSCHIILQYNIITSSYHLVKHYLTTWNFVQQIHHKHHQCLRYLIVYSFCWWSIFDNHIFVAAKYSEWWSDCKPGGTVQGLYLSSDNLTFVENSCLNSLLRIVFFPCSTLSHDMITLLEKTLISSTFITHFDF